MIFKLYEMKRVGLYFSKAPNSLTIDFKKIMHWMQGPILTVFIDEDWRRINIPTISRCNLYPGLLFSSEQSLEAKGCYCCTVGKAVACLPTTQIYSSNTFICTILFQAFWSLGDWLHHLPTHDRSSSFPVPIRISHLQKNRKAGLFISRRVQWGR